MVLSGELWPKGDVLPTVWHLEADRTQPVVAGLSDQQNLRRQHHSSRRWARSEYNGELTESREFRGVPLASARLLILAGFHTLLREGVTVAKS